MLIVPAGAAFFAASGAVRWRLADEAARDRAVREKLAARPDPLAEESAVDADRQLCPDGACTGLLGPDGRCKVCGRTGS
jgi:hypothetical protein